MSNISFVARVNVFRIADVYDYCHASLWLTESHSLRFAEFGPLTLNRIRLYWLPVCELNKIEREVPFIPGIAPVTNHQGKQRAVLISTPGVAFALIPDGS